MDSVRHLRLRPEPFPFIDPEIRCHVKAMASGNAVRSDRPFDDVRQPVRSAIAVDMEGAAFYRTLADFKAMVGILIKSVCDFADPDKDDTYHQFAAEASARYLYALLREYVTAAPPRAEAAAAGPVEPRSGAAGRTDETADLLRRLSASTSQDAVVVLQAAQTALHQTVRLDQGLYVHRNLEDAVEQIAFGVHHEAFSLLVVGGAGVGKTSLLWRLYQKLSLESNLLVWFLRSSYLRMGSDPASQTRILDPAALVHAARLAAASSKQVVLLLDTVDLLLHSEESRDFLLDLLRQLRDSNCHTVLTCRYGEARLLGPIVTSSYALDDYEEAPRNELHLAIEAHCRIFYQGSPVEEAEAGIRHLKESVARGLPLKSLIVNPLLMRMLFSIYAPHRVPDEIHVFRLYEEYWERRVKTDVRAGNPLPEIGARDLTAAASVTAIIMLAAGSPEVHEGLWMNSADALGVPPEDRESLVTRGIVRRSETGTVAFFHQTFFEHSAARGLVAHFGPNSLKLIRARVDERKTDLFLAPVYEQALLLGEAWPGMNGMAEAVLSAELVHDLVTRRMSGIYVYCHRRAVPESLTSLVTSRIPDEDSVLIGLLLHAAANVSSARIASFYIHLDAVWGRRNATERTYVVELLERFANRAASETIAFIEAHDVVAYVLSLPTTMTLDRTLVQVLGTLSVSEPVWAWERLIEMYSAGAKRAVSQELLISIFRVMSANAPRFGLQGIATRLERRLPAWHGDQVSRFQALGDALGELWCVEWQAKGATFDDILIEIEAASDALRLHARFAGLVSWALRTPASDINRIVQAASRPHAHAWLWTGIVLPRLLSRHADLDRRADVLALAEQMCLDSLAEGQGESLAQFRRSVLVAKLPPAAFNRVFADRRFDAAEVWLDINALGGLLGDAYLAGHPGALRAVSILHASPARFDERLRNGVRARLAEAVSTSLDIARLVLSFGIQLRDAKGLAVLAQTVSRSWPALLLENADALVSLRDHLLESRSGTAKRHAITLWTELVRAKVVAPPSTDALFELFNRLHDIPARSHVIELVGLAAVTNSEPLDPILDRLAHLREDRFESIAEAARLAITTAGARSGAEACRVAARVFDLLLSGSVNTRLVAALGHMLKLASNLCPATGYELCKLLLTAPSVVGLGTQAKRMLVHRLRGAVRNAIQVMTPVQRRDMADMIRGMDRHLGRIVVEALCKDDFNEVRAQLDTLLLDNATDGHVKEMIRRQKYVRERTVGGDAWAELLDMWQVAQLER